MASLASKTCSRKIVVLVLIKRFFVISYNFTIETLKRH